MWVRAQRELPDDVRHRITSFVGARMEEHDAVWIELSTGARVVLTTTAGHGRRQTTTIHAMHISPVGVVTDVSLGLFGEPVPLDMEHHGEPASLTPRAMATSHLEQLLAVPPPLDLGDRSSILTSTENRTPGRSSSSTSLP
ncbi:MAG: hypothetical protein K0S37_3247 [Microbacterium sp.]|jgi:hypothetical protein|nr:hypothetical protein [Microbacterium sp.]